MKNSPSLRFFFAKKIMQLLLITLVCILLKKLNIQPGQTSAGQPGQKGSLVSQSSPSPIIKKDIKTELLMLPACAFNYSRNPVAAFHPVIGKKNAMFNSIIWEE